MIIQLFVIQSTIFLMKRTKLSKSLGKEYIEVINFMACSAERWHLAEPIACSFISLLSISVGEGCGHLDSCGIRNHVAKISKLLHHRCIRLEQPG